MSISEPINTGDVGGWAQQEINLLGRVAETASMLVAPGDIGFAYRPIDLLNWTAESAISR